ncbi:hypothetical protein C2G38_2143860 [Gigaspora rosea]|uniref:Uncharacterized protein n=1 Tax=Gigaspora rosea TaxID=44941 RepID=A0A397UZP5_9GLOM|nr:hypothetical protein C2G38_2143860 [Gigaspora rosea]
MCLTCYNAIVVNGSSTYVEHAAEWARVLKRHRNDNLSMSESISLLINIIFEREVIGNDPPIVTFSQLKLIAEDKNDQLSFFFNEIEEIACLGRKNEAEQRALERSLAYQCYLMCWNQCMAIPLWNLRDESTANEDNLSFDGVSTEAIDALLYAGITISRRHLDREKSAIANNHPYKVTSYLENKKNNALVLNVDDYHNIHTKRTPDTCSTSSAAHMTTLLLNSVDSMAIPRVTPNGISIHNPKLIDSNLICTFLDSYYMGRMAKTFNDQLYYKVSLDKKLENMTLHKYDDRIKERQKERKMKDTILLDFFELSLKEMDSYIIALQEVYKIPLLTNYLADCVIPVVGDWPGQVFTRQAITLRLLNRKDDIPNDILSFIPIIGVLHTQLNLLESILKTYWDFFNLKYQYVFSTSKMLSKTPSPYRIFVLLELIRGAWKEIKPIIVGKFDKCCKDTEFLFLFELLDNTVPVGLDIYSTLFRSGDWNSYIEGVFRAWSIFLRFERHNYNKAPLAFLSDIFYWSQNNYPILDVLKDHLVKFTDYPVENMHSRIRRQTSSCDSPQQLSKTAKVVNARKTLSGFEDVFVVQKKSTFADNDHLALLTKKAEVFLLETFGNVYRKLGQSSIIKGQKEKNTYKLVSLDFTVDKKQMQLEFSSEHLPAYDKCDHCHLLLHDGTGIRTNVSSLLSRLSKLATKNPQDQMISDEDDILEVLRKDKQALPRVEQAYSTALERFLNI